MIINFYGKLSETIGRTLDVVLPEGVRDISDLRAFLAERHGHARSDLLGPAVRACVADSVVAEDFNLADVETVEFFPPLSGG